MTTPTGLSFAPGVSVTHSLFSRHWQLFPLPCPSHPSFLSLQTPESWKGDCVLCPLSPTCPFRRVTEGRCGGAGVWMGRFLTSSTVRKSIGVCFSIRLGLCQISMAVVRVQGLCLFFSAFPRAVWSFYLVADSCAPLNFDAKQDALQSALAKRLHRVVSSRF